MVEQTLSREELEALKSRVRQGNEKLFQAWCQIREMPHGTEEWNAQMDRWNQAQEKLHLLCLELKHRFDYCDCLYLDENGKKTKRCLDEPGGWWCQVCPSAKEYWAEELMSLSSPRVKQTEHGAEQMEFIQKLGGEK